jgi:hypothetical protein
LANTAAAVSATASVEPTPTAKRTDAIRAAEHIVELYWTMSDAEAYTRLFSKAYRQRLMEINGIKNADEYEAQTGNQGWEGGWVGSTVEGAWANREANDVEIKVLAKWEDEGSDGVSTFYFFVHETAEGWRIEHIFARGLNPG